MVIDDGPFGEDEHLDKLIPSRSPSPVRNQDDVDIDDIANNMTEQEIQQKTNEHQMKSRAQVLEIINDLPDADIEPPKNVLFVCKLNQVTQEQDLELIFSRFGPIKQCEIIKDWKSGDSL